MKILHVLLESEGAEIPLEAGVAKDLHVDILVGNDINKFPHMVNAISCNGKNSNLGFEYVILQRREEA